MAGAVPSLLFVACSVVTLAPGEPLRVAAQLPFDVARRFDYLERGTPVTSWTQSLVVAHDRYDVFEINGSVTLRGDNVSNPVEAEYWCAKGTPGRKPVVIVTPILGGGEDVARLMARQFAESGMHAIICKRGVRVLAPDWDEDRVERELRRGIVARRRLVDWLDTRSEVDPQRIAAFGVSMGGIVTSVLAPVEPRIHSSIVALAGGDLASVVMASGEPRLKSYRKARMELEHLDGTAFEKKLREALNSDPANLAPFVDPRSVLLFVARWDETVPTKNQELLRDALGKPLTFDLPSGHYSTIAFTPFIRAQSTAWLLERFRTPNPRAASEAPVAAGARPEH
jgi:dienelactone hydrolase